MSSPIDLDMKPRGDVDDAPGSEVLDEVSTAVLRVVDRGVTYPSIIGSDNSWSRCWRLGRHHGARYLDTLLFTDPSVISATRAHVNIGIRKK